MFDVYCTYAVSYMYSDGGGFLRRGSYHLHVCPVWRIQLAWVSVRLCTISNGIGFNHVASWGLRLVLCYTVDFATPIRTFLRFPVF